MSKPQIAVAGLLAAGVGSVTTLYGAYLASHTDRLVEAKVLGGWLLAVAGIVVIPLAQVAARHVEPLDWRTQVARPALGLLSGGAALVHFAAIGEHFEEYWLFGVFFVGLSLFQMVWAIAVVVGRGRLLLWIGAAANALVVATWGLSRASGLPIGPEAGEPIEAGFGDALVTGFEGLIVLGAVVLLRSGTVRGGLRPVTAIATTVILGLLVVVGTALALISVAGGSTFVPPAG